MEDYSINEYGTFSSEDEEKITGFPTYKYFYLVSRIPNLEDFYDGCLLMSLKTSNNQEIIDKMSFNKYLNLSAALNRYIERENAANNGENTNTEAEDKMKEIKNSSNEMMAKAKSQFKVPSFKI